MNNNINIPVKKLEKSKFIRVKDAVGIYAMSRTKIEEVAKDAGALYKVNKVVLIKTEAFDRYLESFKLDSGL